MWQLHLVAGRVLTAGLCSRLSRLVLLAAGAGKGGEAEATGTQTFKSSLLSIYIPETRLRWLTDCQQTHKMRIFSRCKPGHVLWPLPEAGPAFDPKEHPGQERCCGPTCVLSSRVRFLQPRVF